ncbi:Rhophilin-2 [Homalodisca vitripennis]|nr:Rhophilin-2 [Homalodisca vitripennis]
MGATTNRKLKETVALELSFVNSNLQLLKEQLAELNSSVELYQGDRVEKESEVTDCDWSGGERRKPGRPVHAGRASC